MDNKVPVAPIDLLTMLLSTIRYSFGRRSYITGVCFDLLKDYGKHLELRHLEQIAKEIAEELRRCEVTHTLLGSEIDDRQWRVTLHALDDMIFKRYHGGDQ